MNEALTATTLRAMFQDHRVVQGRMKLPSRRGLDNLVESMNRLSWMASHSSRWRELNQTRQKLADALRMIDEAIPALQSCLQGDDPYAEAFQGDVAALSNLANASAAVQQRQYLTTPFSFNLTIDKWQDYVEQLATDFREIMELANPNLKLRYSNEGPVARFLIMAIGHITGERPDIATVAQYTAKKLRIAAETPCTS